MEITQTDESGKLCIPEDICRKLGLKPGTRFQISLRGTDILLTKIDADNIATEGEEVELLNLAKLSELSLEDFLNEEPDLYTDDDLKVKYS